ncbi:MAG: hypothetical protein ACREMR_01160 [Gemmatimonadales bacterium]
MLRNTPLLALVAAVAVAASASCKAAGRSQAAANQARIDSLTAAGADRERLVAELADNARLLSDISAELAKVRVPPRQLRVSRESPLHASRDSMLQTIRYATRRLNEVEPRLRESERRIKELTTLSDSLREDLQATVSNYHTVIESQKATIVALSDQVSELVAVKAALEDSLGSVSRRENTVYYVVGTKDELLERGIVVQEGGARFLFILWKSGETLAPARELDRRAFTAINKRDITEIPLPDSQKEYRIASRQALEYLATPPSEDNTIRGTARLKITDSEQFWAASKFLIIVES